MKMTRKDFLVGMAASGALAGCRGLRGAEGPRWYKGMMHCHTYWSDGRGFPEDAAKAYRDLGYDFLSITDHNRIGVDGDQWRNVEPEDGPWPPQVSQPVFDHYRKTFPQVRTRMRGGKTQVRLQPFAETRQMFEADGRFLLMPGTELTMAMPTEGNRYDVHMNCVNVPRVLDDVAHDDLIAHRKDVSVREMVARSLAAWQKDADTFDEPSVFILNHPQWPILDVSPEDLIALRDVRYFEICNCGADHPVPPELGDDGWYNDRFWDVVNAFRARRGERLLYAVASDDSHWYPNGHARKPWQAGTPGDGYVRVFADTLTPAALFAAMDRGRFHASCGVDLDEVAFDGRTLSVRVLAKPGVKHTVRFIVSKRGFAETPAKTLHFDFPQGKGRDVAVYGRGIGETAKTVEGRTGEGLTAAYALTEDDLYVRARVESDEPSYYQPAPSFHPKVRCAWTQPYARAVI